MDPTPTEVAALNACMLIAEWVPVDGEESADASTFRGALFRALGIRGDMHPRVLAGMSEASFNTAVGTVQVSEGEALRAPTPAEVSQAGLMMRAARVSCGLPGGSPAAANADLQQQVQPLQAQQQQQQQQLQQ